MTVRLKDIAERAGISISTVSRIINDDPNKPASAKTKELVWKIVHELGYTPNVNARNLVVNGQQGEKDKRTRAIGCIFTSTKDTYHDPFFSKIALGVQSEAAKRGYVMGYSFSSCDMNNSALYNNIASNEVDGAVILGQFSEEYLQFFKSNIRNLVYAGINHINGVFDEVISDGYKGAIAAVEHLISVGHEEIGYIGAIPNTELNKMINEHRFKGYLHAMKKHGLNIDKKHIRNIELSTGAGYKGMKDLIKKNNIPNAIFCANDNVAIGVMKAVHEAGLEIPKDIALMGLDDIEMANYVRPALSTVHIPKKELGRWAVKILIDRIEKGHEMLLRMDLPFRVVVRETCGAEMKEENGENE